MIWDFYPLDKTPNVTLKMWIHADSDESAVAGAAAVVWKKKLNPTTFTCSPNNGRVRFEPSNQGSIKEMAAKEMFCGCGQSQYKQQKQNIKMKR